MLAPVGARPGDVRYNPLQAVVLHLGALLVAGMFGAEYPPPVVLLLEVAGVAAQLQHVLVAKGSNLGELIGGGRKRRQER